MIILKQMFKGALILLAFITIVFVFAGVQKLLISWFGPLVPIAMALFVGFLLVSWIIGGFLDDLED